MIKKLYLVDRNPDLVSEWRKAFREFKEVEVLAGDFFQVETNVIVSPANSFGFMDGGLDYYIRETLGFEIEERLKIEIARQYHGELPIGHCLTIPTNKTEWPFLSAIPTMRLPGNIHGTLNVYYAFRALLLSAVHCRNDTFKSVLCPGLGTGTGGVSAKKCAGQMVFAYKQLKENPTIGFSRDIQRANIELESYR